jgi:LysR family glycine cleavage system transcriptional activator
VLAHGAVGAIQRHAQALQLPDLGGWNRGQRRAGAGAGGAGLGAAGQLVQPFPELFLPPVSLWLIRPEGRSAVRKIERFREWLMTELAAERARGMAPPEVWIEPPQ